MRVEAVTVYNCHVGLLDGVGILALCFRPRVLAHAMPGATRSPQKAVSEERLLSHRLGVITLPR